MSCFCCIHKCIKHISMRWKGQKLSDMVHITENKHYYPPLTGVPSTLIICKQSWRRRRRRKGKTDYFYNDTPWFYNTYTYYINIFKQDKCRYVNLLKVHTYVCPMLQSLKFVRHFNIPSQESEIQIASSDVFVN